jgi:uncharacterized protein YkwD
MDGRASALVERPEDTDARRAVGHVVRVLLALTVAAALVLIGSRPASGSTASELSDVVDVIAAGQHRWLVTRSGSVQPLGSSPHFGDGTGGQFVAAAAHPDGMGYWLSQADGSITGHGSASFHGEFTRLAPGTHIVDMSGTPSGLGYWLVASDGGIFSFGDAQFFGSTGAIKLNRPVVGMHPTPTGLGYWLVASDGGIFSFGDAQFLGSLASHGTDTVIGIEAVGTGYMIADRSGHVAEFANDGRRTFGAWSVDRSSTEKAIAAELYTRLTVERDERGLPPLLWDSQLAAGAHDWSADMAANGFRHADLRPLLADLSGYDAIAENIYRGDITHADSGSAHMGFMESDAHRDTMLATRFSTVGISVACDGDALWVTVRFGTPITQLTTGSRPKTQPDPVVSDDGDGSRC